jgi:hypothetical protein
LNGEWLHALVLFSGQDLGTWLLKLWSGTDKPLACQW